jgi:hypothetical protein
MKALAILCEGDRMCCRCALACAEKSGAPHLFMASVQYRICKDSDMCSECNGDMGSARAIAAAAKLEKIMKGESS